MNAERGWVVVGDGVEERAEEEEVEGRTRGRQRCVVGERDFERAEEVGWGVWCAVRGRHLVVEVGFAGEVEASVEGRC